MRSARLSISLTKILTKKGGENVKRKYIRISVTKNDGDLIGWKNALPHGRFSETVNKILVWESYGKVGRIPCEFSSAEIKEGDTFGFYVTDEKALELLNGMEKGTRSKTVKEIIRRHIDCNRKEPPGVIHAELLKSTVESFRTKMEAKEAEYQGQPDKYCKLCASYDLGTKMLFDTILACYESGDEILGDAKLQELNVDEIVIKAYEENFGPQFYWEEDDDE